GNTGAAIAGGLSPYANLAVKNATTNENGEVNTTANVMAHAILGAIEARISNSNVAAGAVAGGGGELMANVIAKTLYGVDGTTKTANDLTEAQKNTITVLSQLAGGLAGGLLGDSTQSAVVSSEVSKRAVEDNYLKENEALDFEKEFKTCKKRGETSCSK
ncbi:VENN motif pre-toxin domain-containing protein, partial [Pasteurellaceae bacterium LIM206]|nr:VENN motif pre-toxin domain-containing protein [Pasteurellaceae bacterium LIM206]